MAILIQTAVVVLSGVVALLIARRLGRITVERLPDLHPERFERGVHEFDKAAAEFAEFANALKRGAKHESGQG